MKNKLMLMGIVAASVCVRVNAVFYDDRDDRKHAHVLVKYMYTDMILQKFEEGQIGKENRKRLREELLDDCPIAYRDASIRSLAGLLVWREKRFLDGEPLEN